MYVHPIFTLWHYPIENSLLCLRGKYPNIDISLEHESLIPEFSNQHTNFASKIAKIALFSTIQVKWYHENMISTLGLLLVFCCSLFVFCCSYIGLILILVLCCFSVGHLLVFCQTQTNVFNLQLIITLIFQISYYDL